MRFNTLTFGLISSSLLIAASGCSTIPFAGKFLHNNSVTMATPENPVTRMVCLWEPSEGRNLQGMPSRGVRGQIMFFTQGSDSPVAVNGDVKIYQFDNHGPREKWDKPIHEFMFTAEQWNSFLQPGMLGPQYNVFIPYMKRHPEQVTVALQIRFTPREGASAPIYSQTSNTALPGTFRDEDVAEFARRQAITSGASPAAKHAAIAELLGTLPPKTPATTRLQSGENHSFTAQQPLPGSDSNSVKKPQITTVNYAFEEEQDPSEPEPPRRQFHLSPAQ